VSETRYPSFWLAYDLHLHTRVEAVAFAGRQGLVSEEGTKAITAHSPGFAAKSALPSWDIGERNTGRTAVAGIDSPPPPLPILIQAAEPCSANPKGDQP
jgi:hypothetical protein